MNTDTALDGYRTMIGHRAETSKTKKTMHELGQLISTTRSVDKALDALNDYAFAEAQADLWRAVHERIRYGVPAETALREVSENLVDSISTTGADDRWSGRKNDLRRTQFDGRRQWLYDVRLLLRQCPD